MELLTIYYRDMVYISLEGDHGFARKNGMLDLGLEIKNQTNGSSLLTERNIYHNHILWQITPIKVVLIAATSLIDHKSFKILEKNQD